MTTDPYRQIEFMLRSGQAATARSAAEQLTRSEPSNARSWFLLGASLMALGRPAMAVKPLRQARALATTDDTISGALYQALVQGGQRLESLAQHTGAEAMYREAVAMAPNAVQAHISLAKLLNASGCYDEARSHLRDVLARYPGQQEACAVLALSYEFEGDLTRAMETLREPLRQLPVAPPIALAYAALAGRIGEECSAIAHLEALLSTQVSRSVRRDSHFMLGKLYDARGDYDHAFEHFGRANSLLDYQYDRQQTHRFFQSIADAFPAARKLELPRSDIDSALPVFVVGMPRSGTTLVEQILASHPQVFGAGERDDIAAIVHALGGPGHADARRIAVAELDRHARKYIDTLSALAPDARRIVDKMPHNFLALGYIDLLFPGSRVIHCVRDPRDTCLSIWFQPMTGNHPYTNDLDALADYYRQYQTLMAHWKTVVRVPIHEVRYEELVRDIATNARSLVEFCGLEWDERCLNFHENARVVTTPTYGDVRRPVHDKSVARWRHYERHLAPLAGLNP